MSSKEKNHQIYIRGFSSRTTEDDLQSWFKKYGRIKDVHMKGAYAFVEYEEEEEVETAVQKMNGTTKDGNKLVVEPAGRDRRERRRSGQRRGPQGEDECFYCHGKGHWRNECKEFLRQNRDRRRHNRRSSSSSSSSSSSAERRKSRRDRDKKKKDKDRRRRSSSSSESRSRSKDRRDRRDRQEKDRKRDSSQKSNGSRGSEKKKSNSKESAD